MIHIRTLFEFLDELREANYNVSVEHYSKVHDLLLMLAASGGPPPELRRFRSLIGPVVCSTPAEQADFSVRFEQWIAQLEAKGKPPLEAPGHFSRIGALAFHLKRHKAALAVAAVLVAIVAWWYASSGPEVSLQKAWPSEIPELPLWFMVFVVVCGLLYLAWLLGQQRQFLIRREARGALKIRRLFVENLHGQLFPYQYLAEAARKLHIHRQIQTEDLEPEGTVERTTAEAGWFTPVFETRLVVPEFVALIERTGFRDQKASLIDELLDRIESENINLARYYFARDPRRCTPSGKDSSPCSLEDLASRWSDQALWIFSDTTNFFSPFTGRLDRWVDILRAWPVRTILTSEPPATWGARESRLVKSGFQVFPATAEGLIASVSVDSSSATNDYYVIPRLFPLFLREDPRRWLASDPPRAVEVDLCLRQVHNYLGKEGFAWLQACAVYPELLWELTLFLGRNLRDDSSEAILSLERLRALTRLPWLRAGYLPDWLRSRLLDDLPRNREREIRNVLQRLLLSALTRPVASFELEITQERDAAVSRQWNVVARRLRQSRDSENQLTDRIMLSWLDSRLAFRLPWMITRWLRRSFSGGRRRAIIDLGRLRGSRPDFLRVIFSSVAENLKGIGNARLARLWRYARALLMVGLAFGAAYFFGISGSLLLVLGLALLYAGGELLVDNSIRLAKRFSVSNMVIGLTVVAFGTSCPELAASLIAALTDVPDIAVGNVFGSNVANVGLILGLSALILPFRVTVAFVRREVAFMIFATLLVYPLMIGGRLSRLEGLALFLLLVGFIYVLLRDPEAQDEHMVPAADLETKTPRPIWLASLGVLVGVGLLVAGAKSLVSGAVTIATDLGVPERVIGFTMVALGTSLPGLAASVVAARKGEGDIVMGNVVGSNIFNLLCILGLTALVVPIRVSPESMVLDFWMMLGPSLLLFVFLAWNLRLLRLEGAILLLLYLGYVGYLSVG